MGRGALAWHDSKEFKLCENVAHEAVSQGQLGMAGGEGGRLTLFCAQYLRTLLQELRNREHSRRVAF